MDYWIRLQQLFSDPEYWTLAILVSLFNWLFLPVHLPGAGYELAGISLFAELYRYIKSLTGPKKGIDKRSK